MFESHIVYGNLIVLIFLCQSSLKYFVIYHISNDLVFGVVSQLGITASAHRLWSHRFFKAKFPLRLLLTSVINWCRDHHLHHKYFDTHTDPHNINRGFFFSHIGWIRKHRDIKEKGKGIDFSDLYKDPMLKAIQLADSNAIIYLIFEESHHNYHHTFPWNYRSSELINPTNLTRRFIEFFAKIGWAYDLKFASEDMIKKRVDGTGNSSHLFK
ncbi:hypothetical protein ABEB36_008111 [Hypothenemus hampei]|uniref:Uncharacterized protein n=1 Tax=Hypothenemus hampei TaxID=57062 RepID=A0ABD1EMZ1_HYPHA